MPGDAVFSTAEIFWRPSDFLNSSTRTFELYGRLSNTLYNNGGKTASQTVSNPCGGGNIQVDETSNNGISGLPTTVGSLGMRFTPSTEVGLTFGLNASSTWAAPRGRARSRHGPTNCAAH